MIQLLQEYLMGVCMGEQTKFISVIVFVLLFSFFVSRTYQNRLMGSKSKL